MNTYMQKERNELVAFINLVNAYVLQTQVKQRKHNRIVPKDCSWQVCRPHMVVTYNLANASI